MERIVFTVHQRGIDFDGKIINGKDIEKFTKVILKKEYNNPLSDTLIAVYVPSEKDNDLALLGYVNESYTELMFGSKECDWDLYNLLPDEIEGIMDRKERVKRENLYPYYLFRVEIQIENPNKEESEIKEPEIDTTISEETINALKDFKIDLSIDSILQELLTDSRTLNRLLRNMQERK